MSIYIACLCAIPAARLKSSPKAEFNETNHSDGKESNSTASHFRFFFLLASSMLTGHLGCLECPCSTGIEHCRGGGGAGGGGSRRSGRC